MTLPANYNNSQYLFPSDRATSLGRFEQAFPELISYTLDYGQWLVSGETIVSMAYEVYPATTPALATSGSTIDGSGQKVTFRVTGGVDGQQYQVYSLATTSNGQVKRDRLDVSIIDLVLGSSADAVYAYPTSTVVAQLLAAASNASASASSASISAQQAATFLSDLIGGRVWLGSGVPTVGAPTTIVAGDAYVDIVSGNLWGPYSGTAWPGSPVFNIKYIIPPVLDGNTSIIQFKRTNTGVVPTSLADGEPMIDRQNGILYWSSTDGTIHSTPLNSNVANGIAKLDGTGRLALAQIPTALVGAVQYQGTWNAATNTPTLVSATGIKGQYYYVGTPGTVTIDGHSVWGVGDLIIFDGVRWEWVNNQPTSTALVPIGASMEFAGLTPPAMWQFEFGQAISRTVYAAAFEVLTKTVSATYSSGSTTLALESNLTGLGLEFAIVEGPGIPIGAHLNGSLSSSSGTLNVPTTAASGGEVTIRLLPWGQGDGSTTFNIPDSRDVVFVGRGNMGGTARGLLGTYLVSTVLNAFGGEEGHTLTTLEMPSHNHAITDPGHTHAVTDPGHRHPFFASIGTTSAQAGGSSVGYAPGSGNTNNATTGITINSITTGITTNNAGSGNAHNNMQPTSVKNKIIFLGA